MTERLSTYSTTNEKRSKDYTRRKWYYEKKFRDNDCKHDPHPEIRAIYFDRNPHDPDLEFDRDARTALRARRQLNKK